MPTPVCTPNPEATRGTRGSSLVESMMAFALLSTTAIAIFPIFTTVKKQSKYGDFRQLCERVVNDKLNQYVQGRPVNLVAEAGGDARLGNLSVASFSTSTIGGGLVTGGGFLYTKLRYNKYFPYACNGRVDPATIIVAGNSVDTDRNGTLDLVFPGVPASEQQLGMRECVGTSAAWVDGSTPVISPDADANVCATALDSQVRRELPGFKLYVKLQLETPWSQMAPKDDAGNPIEPFHPDPALASNAAGQSKDSQYSSLCPNNGSWAVADSVGINTARFDAVTAGNPGTAVAVHVAQPRVHPHVAAARIPTERVVLCLCDSARRSEHECQRDAPGHLAHGASCNGFP